MWGIAGQMASFGGAEKQIPVQAAAAPSSGRGEKRKPHTHRHNTRSSNIFEGVLVTFCLYVVCSLVCCLDSGGETNPFPLSSALSRAKISSINYPFSPLFLLFFLVLELKQEVVLRPISQVTLPQDLIRVGGQLGSLSVRLQLEDSVVLGLSFLTPNPLSTILESFRVNFQGLTAIAIRPLDHRGEGFVAPINKLSPQSTYLVSE